MREGWVCEDFGNCIKLKSGDNLTAKKMVAGSFPVYGGNDIAGYHNQYNLQGDNIIIGRVGAQCGNSRLIREKIWLTDNAFKITDLKYEFDFQFLNYLLNFVGLRDYARQAAQPVISNSSLKKVQLTFPKSIEEQKQIVAILDDAFAAIEQAQANIEKNIDNAKELFQSKLNEIFSQKGEGWEEKTFKDVCVLQRGYDLPKRLRVQGDYPLVSSSGIIDSHVESKVSAPGVVTGRSGSIGNLFYIEEDFWPLNTTLYVKDFKGNLEEYVYYFIKQFDLKRFSSGAGVPTLNRNFVHDEIVFSTNSTKVQKKIVTQLNSLNSQAEQIQATYKQKLTNLEDLKKSLLEQAFAGELTDKDMPA
ncbi:restriction endonuclease subunit S [uncultured Psychrobacter sp.]|uniref:restriction endonuclease subunit S n=1 Tax=uncultured Psychrobacter sp. TaxID=259303 RepID=UPI00262D8F21|nr:restriction endonuclease subunit S [uncultured Psychrobacter sp.]